MHVGVSLRRIRTCCLSEESIIVEAVVILGFEPTGTLCATKTREKGAGRSRNRYESSWVRINIRGKVLATHLP